MRSMKVKIEIDCEDDLSALKAYLSVVRDQCVRWYKHRGSDECTMGASTPMVGSYKVTFEKEEE